MAGPSVQPPPHTLTGAEILARLNASLQGLSQAEVNRRLIEYGPNRLPQPKTPGVTVIFLRQFLSPLIYILLAAAVVSLLLQEWSDASFIFGVLIINAIIGTIGTHRLALADGSVTLPEGKALMRLAPRPVATLNLYIPLGHAWVLRFFLERAIRLGLAEYHQA